MHIVKVISLIIAVVLFMFTFAVGLFFIGVILGVIL